MKTNNQKQSGGSGNELFHSSHIVKIVRKYSDT
jgi:hypothetical protein